jgi:hypothetical protein
MIANKEKENKNKLILKSEEQYDYKLFARSGVKRMIGCCVTSGISSIVALHCI